MWGFWSSAHKGEFFHLTESALGSSWAVSKVNCIQSFPILLRNPSFHKSDNMAIKITVSLYSTTTFLISFRLAIVSSLYFQNTFSRLMIRASYWYSSDLRNTYWINILSDERLKMARPLIKEQEVGLNWYTLQVIYNLKTKYGYFREKSHDIKILQMTPTHTKNIESLHNCD